ncbi:type II secretion system protein [Clostridium kluyveri]|uniref:Prepilin-type N-terminal cleavage/methylation domain-containing protein n=1 Tax=Clostridium kluyveri TaxID=1534 RepID=A0A1L5F654_CLOKL|nr:type II secretion system protein [Clostridium kluyveri]APM38489.1 prepilin-type N-terminal cleavage/methylation domain-containing protein [Clostridium kluyveri]
MEILKKKKGFTLIELMIVLAIVAILAVVLVPKSQIFKNNSKSAGVTTNVNTVRAYLETKVTNNGGVSTYLNRWDLLNQLNGAFSTGNTASQLFNPFTNNKGEGQTKAYEVIDKSSSAGASAKDVPSSEGSVKNDTGITFPNTNKKGEVIIVVYKNGYGIFGIDGGGSATQAFIVQ